MLPFVGVTHFIVVIYKNIKINGFFRTMNTYWFENAYAIDVDANQRYEILWNVIMRKKRGYRFGRFGETISSALGKNQRDKTLSWFGWIWVILLFAIDVKYWLKGGHCINSIQG